MELDIFGEKNKALKIAVNQGAQIKREFSYYSIDNVRRFAKDYGVSPNTFMVILGILGMRCTPSAKKKADKMVSNFLENCSEAAFEKDKRLTEIKRVAGYENVLKTVKGL